MTPPIPSPPRSRRGPPLPGVEAGIGLRLSGGGKCEVSAAIHPARGLLVDVPPRSRSLHLAREMDRVPVESNRVMGLRRTVGDQLVHVSSTVFPSGLTTPIPVTTTLRLPFASLTGIALRSDPAVDQRRRARHEGGCVGAEISDGACDVPRLAEAPERRLVEHRRRRLLGSTSVSCVLTYPGATTFARTLRLPSSRASDFVKPMMPAFEAA